MNAIEIVPIDSSPAGRLLLQRFYDDAYVAQFPDANERESLAQIWRYLRLKAQGWYGANNYHVLVAWQRGAPVGGAVLDYLALPSVGIVEFLFVLPGVRGAGLGKRLLDAGIAAVAADARAQRRKLRAIVAEMNDPYRHPDRPDNMDPFERARVWARWGFHRLLCPYAQPALSARQSAVDYLTLIVRPLREPAPASMSAGLVREIVAEYLRWAMRLDAPQASPEFRRLDAFLQRTRRVVLQSLAASIGFDERKPFQVHELASRKPAHHLWRISLPGRAALDGTASFFSLPSCGFGGQLVLAGPLRGRGLLAPLLARIEARMMADGVREPGWFIECGKDSAGAFRRCGFAEVPLRWHPPAMESPARSERLHLLYKPFGPVYPPVALPLRFIRRALREILGAVYAEPQPQRHPSYRQALDSLAVDGNGFVQLTMRR